MTELKERVPEPAVIRGAITAVVSLVAVVTGYQLDISWLEPALAAYTVLVPLVLSVWIRSKVTPFKKGDAKE